MSRPSRNSDDSHILSALRTFFITTKTATGKNLLQSHRTASLFIDVLRHYVRERKFKVDDFIVMPNHVHVLLTLDADISIEKAVQLIKGCFSYRLKREFGYPGEVWQRGFSESRVDDRAAYDQHREYIRLNPIRAHIIQKGETFPYCFASLSAEKKTGAKARKSGAACGHG